MGNEKQSSGRRVFNDVYSFPQDSQDLADDIHEFANVRVGTSAERQSLPAAQRRVGLLWVETDRGLLLRWDGDDWGPLAPRIGMRRGPQSGTISSSTYTNLAADHFWVEEFNEGFDDYLDGITIPYAGVYEVSYTITAIVGILVGVTVNKSTSITVGDLVAVATSTPVQGIATATASRKIALNAGDRLRLFAIAGSSGGTWRTEPGLSSFQAEFC
jgi:hypothetical protein